MYFLRTKLFLEVVMRFAFTLSARSVIWGSHREASSRSTHPLSLPTPSLGEMIFTLYSQKEMDVLTTTLYAREVVVIPILDMKILLRLK